MAGSKEMKLVFFLTPMAILALSILPVWSMVSQEDSLSVFLIHSLQNEGETWRQKSREEIAREKGYDSWYSYMYMEGPR